MADTMTLASGAKWLRKAAEEIRDEGHPGWGNTCEFAADAIDAAIKQREQDAKDAARYRWLRDKSRQMSHDPDMSGNHHWLFGCNISYALRGPTADAAIDAAMAKESGR
jgi:hypothetical protein